MALSIRRPPYYKGKGFCCNPVVKFGIPDYADSIRNPKVVGTPKWEAYWAEQLHYILHGYQTGSYFIPGRYYYYMNFNSMSTNSGIITPDMCDLHLEIRYATDECKAKGKNIIFAKKRRGGISEEFQKSEVDYNFRFIPGSQTGVAAGQDTFAQEFMKKWRAGDALLPPELRIKTLKDNDNEIIAGYKYKNKDGELVSGGSKSTIYVRTMYKNPALFKGLALSTIIAEECGEFEKLEDFYNDSLACLRNGSIQTGIYIFFGTGGNINKGSADFQKIWHNAEEYNFEKFLIPATRFHFPFYGGASPIRGIEAKTPTLLLTHKPYELIGVEDEVAAKEDILFNRAEALKTKNMKKYREELKNYPLTEADIFTSTVDNDFDIDVLNDQAHEIDSNDKRYVRCQLDYVKDRKTGLAKFPYEIEVRIDNEVDENGVCFLIHQDHLTPIKSWGNVYAAGCLLPGEKVMTENGLMNIEDVTKENLLINEEGKYVKINELLRHEVKNEKVYTLKVSNTFRTTTFTSEHPILISKPFVNETNCIDRKALKFDYVKAPEVELNDWIKVPNIYRIPNDFDISQLWNDLGVRPNTIIDNPLYKPDFWWFIGLWLGDGWCLDKKGKIEFAFNASETEYMQRFEFVVEKLFDRAVGFRIRDRNCVQAHFTNKQLCEFLKKHFGKYAHGKRLPEWAKHINEECKKQLVLGYLNSDGCIAHDKKRNLYNTQFISINLELVESFQDVLFSLGFVPQICKLRNAKKERIAHATRISDIKETYQLRLGHGDTIALVRELWRPTDPKLRRVDFNNLKKLVRKRAADGCFIDESLDYIYFKVREIAVKEYTGTVYNFNCETHTFMCHHITTHNCDSYDKDKAKSSKSLGAMCVLIRRNSVGNHMQLAPVATICCRPARREIFYEMCLKLSIFFNLRENVLIDVANTAIFDYFKNNGGEQYLAYRPKKFESDKSEQTHVYGFYITGNHSKPLMVGLMQSAILDYGNQIWFPELIKQLRNYNEVMIGSDNDLADAYGIALVQDVSSEMRPSDITAHLKNDPMKTTTWGKDSEGNIVPVTKVDPTAGGLFSIEKDDGRRFQ